MCNNQQVLKQWVKEAEDKGKCVKFGFYGSSKFYDYGTIIDWEIDDCDPTQIIEVTSRHFLYYADSFPADEFGQTATFRNPHPCHWLYWDINVSDGPCLPSNSEDILEDPDLFTDWANSKYPNSFSLVGEYIDSDISEWFWDCYTYNPMLIKAEVASIMGEYLATLEYKSLNYRRINDEK